MWGLYAMGKVEKRRQRSGRRQRQDARRIRKRMERRRLMRMKRKTTISRRKRRSNNSRVGFLMARIDATNCWKLTTHLCHDQNRQEEEERLALQLLRVYSFIIKGRGSSSLLLLLHKTEQSNQKETNRSKLPPSVCKTCNRD
jgi:hypothetical protein